MFDPSSVLFIGLGGSAPSWYRCGLPAYSLGSEWLGLFPPTYKGQALFDAPRCGNIVDIPDFSKYEVIIVQQARGDDWLTQIKEWQSEGIKVIYEVDDFLHGIHRMKEHRARGLYHKKFIKTIEACMKQCDAMICSTQFLSDQYKKYNPKQYVCRVGIDTERYVKVEKPERKDIVIGWAGGTGHHNAVGPWLEQIIKLVELYDDVKFASIGTRYADIVNSICGEGKGITVPWISLENFPFAMTNFDIAVAPAHESKYFQSKSDLRWLEASGVAIPTVAHPSIYTDIKDSKTGFLAETPVDAADALQELIEDSQLRHDVGLRAQLCVREKRDCAIMSKQWADVIQEVTNG